MPLDRPTSFPDEYFYENAIHRVGRADSSLRSSSTVQSRCYCSRDARWRRGARNEEEVVEERMVSRRYDVYVTRIRYINAKKSGAFPSEFEPFLRTPVANVLISIGCRSFFSIYPTSRLSERSPPPPLACHGLLRLSSESLLFIALPAGLSMSGYFVTVFETDVKKKNNNLAVSQNYLDARI